LTSKLNAEFAEAQRAAEYLFSPYRYFLVADSPKKCVQGTTRRETGHHLVAAKGRAKITLALSESATVAKAPKVVVPVASSDASSPRPPPKAQGRARATPMSESETRDSQRQTEWHTSPRL